MTERDIFLTATQITDLSERQAYLNKACGSDVALLQQIEAQLKSHEEIASEAKNGTEAYTPMVGNEKAPPTPYFSDLKGVTIAGKYKLRQRLGIGGMGEVWAADQTEPVKRHVAIKLIKSGMDSATICARFDQERQALAMMDHPNIARVLDAGTTEDNRPYFVMELVKGTPITRYCDQEHLSLKERLELFVPVCQAVQHAHQKGIIHRDLKPSNILIALYDGRPVPKVIDFGVSKAIHQKITDQTMFTEIGSIIGTLEYMAPEQAELNNLDIDTRADIYSLGVILYEMLAGSPPFSSKQLRAAAFTEMIRLIREVEPPKPSTKLSASEELPNIAANRKLEPKRLRSVVAGDLDWIVMKALEKDRNRRYETPNGFAMDLQRYLADEPVLAGPPSVTYLVKKFFIRNKGLVTAAALIVLTLIVGILGTTFGLFEARRQRDQAEAARANEADQRKQAEVQRDRAAAAEKLAQTERDRTNQEAGRANALNDFMVQMFLAVDPEQRGSREVTVLELLNKASEKVDKTLKEQPLAEAAARTFLGNTFRSLGKIDQAIKELNRAVALRETNGEANTMRHAETLRTLGRTFTSTGQPKEALACFTKAQQILESLGDQELRHQVTQLNDIADSYLRLSRFAEAEQSVNRAEAVLDRLPKTTPAMLCKMAQLRSQLAGEWKGDLELAEKYQEQALAYCREDNNAGNVSSHLNSLATIRMNRGKLDEALDMFEEALEQVRKEYGSVHPELANLMENIGNVYFRKKDYDKASEQLKQVAAMRETIYGAGSFPAARTRFNQAVILSNKNDFKQALELMDAVLPIFRKNVGDKNLEVGSIMRQRAICMKGLKDYDGALRELKAVLALVDSVGKPTTDLRLTTLLNMVQVYQLQGAKDQAEATKKLALSALDAAKPDHAKWIKRFDDSPTPAKTP